MFLVYRYISVLNSSVYLECIYFVIITCHSVFQYKTNSISYKLIDLVWIDRMYNKINQSIDVKLRSQLLTINTTVYLYV